MKRKWNERIGDTTRNPTKVVKDNTKKNTEQERIVAAESNRSTKWNNEDSEYKSYMNFFLNTFYLVSTVYKKSGKNPLHPTTIFQIWFHFLAETIIKILMVIFF